MNQKQMARRTCPACGSDNYLFRGRKKIEAQDGKPEETETRYRCKECDHGWKERVPVKGGT
jgi:DNA-directed RNA polymerase subunit M/transcription elongation factor TFIIS